MADTTTRLEFSDEVTKEERRRETALFCSVTMLQGYDPPPGKTRSDAAIGVAKKFAEYLGGTT